MAKLIDNDRGLKALRAKFKRRSKPMGCYAGFGKEAYHEGASLPMATLGAVHEFGIGVPERSHLRLAFDLHQAEYVSQMEGVADEFFYPTEKDSLLMALETIGQQYIDDVRNQIYKGLQPPLVERTIENRPSGGPPLMATGEYIDGLSTMVVSEQAKRNKRTKKK